MKGDAILLNINDNINPDFDIPYYIFEEIMKYITEKSTNNGKASNSKLLYLLNLAVISKRLSKEQAKFLRETFGK